MRAVLLVGHGSLRAGSGAAMIRLAARAREAGVAPIVEAGFLNYSRPAFAEALARCVARGASAVVVQPYFLVPGKFVRVDVPRLLPAAREAYPGVRFALAAPFGDHPALAELVLQRALEAVCGDQGSGIRDQESDVPASALLIMAHGSPDPSANQPIEAVVERVRAAGLYRRVMLAYMDLNEPRIPAAIDDLAADVERIVALPYFLQLGGHVAEDLPTLIATARQRHPATSILLAGYLAYHPLLVSVIADRVAEAWPLDDRDRCSLQ